MKGSSPLARGTLCLFWNIWAGAGLIPARAGNTKGKEEQDGVRGAHPRSRGEHNASLFTLPHSSGSSPLARGTQSTPRGSRENFGLIPARAGNTGGPFTHRRGDRAHPRSRGEHIKATIDAISSAGSSPLARGTPGRHPHLLPGCGLIPARAGNTFCSGIHSLRTWAHPRSRGEHLPAGQEALAREGSSPLARGTRAEVGGKSDGSGLIPARAGNTQQSCWRDKCIRAHPRSRGEHVSTTLVIEDASGSSPLARGTHEQFRSP